jgi:hypothetical protein
MADRPARAPTQLQYLAWDGTDPQDSIRLAQDLARSFRCINLLDDSPSGEFGVIGSPRIFQPCGKDGTDRTDLLWVRGMFEFPRTFFNPVHNNAGGDLPAILQYSGHGIPGFMFSQNGILIVTSRAMNGTRSPTGSLDWKFVDDAWNNPSTKVVILSACRQLQGKPQQFLWSNRMRGGANRVHTILGYRETAPLAKTSADINDVLIANLRKGQSFITAWRGAHVAAGIPRNWAALAFKSSVNDRMDHWVRDGALPAEPAVDEDILYFDEANRSGRVVKTPTPDFSMDMTFVVGTAAIPAFPALIPGDVVPPWTILRPGTFVNLRLRFITDTFQDGDTVWIGLIQVRPDYHAPFDIMRIIKFINQDDVVLKTGIVQVLGRLHDISRGWKPDEYNDVYSFEIDNKGMSFASLDSSKKALTIPMVIGNDPKNGGYAIFYMMVRVEREGKVFGIPTVKHGGLPVADPAKLIDEPQFCVFNLVES